MLLLASTDDKFIVMLIVSIGIAEDADSERSNIVCNGLTIRRARTSIVGTALDILSAL